MDEEKLITDNMGLVYTILHRFNLAYNDDAFSMALEGLMNAARSYDSNKNIAFSTYAYTCVYNAVAGYLRKKASEPTTLQYDEETFGDVPDYSTPESEYLRKERLYYFCKAIDKVYDSLTLDSHKDIIAYWRQTGYTAGQCEIAQVVGVSQACVSRVLAVFKHKLKQEMEDYEC